MSDSEEVLLGKINKAVAEHNAAEQAVTTAQSELVSKSKLVGQLLLEAKKHHPKVVDFEAFLKRVKGLKLSRTYDLLRLAGGRSPMSNCARKLAIVKGSPEPRRKSRHRSSQSLQNRSRFP